MFTRRISSFQALFCLLGLLCLTLPSAQASETVLHSFSSNYQSGAYPVGQLAVYGSQFYGVTQKGINGYGNIFRLSPAGVITNLHEFNGADGATPYSGMVQVNGILYGTTPQGGTANLGVLYKISTNGYGFMVLHHFTGYNSSNPAASDGGGPMSALTPGSDGKLYGVTYAGGVKNTSSVVGPGGDGALYSFDPSTNTYTILHSFSNNTDGGAYPDNALAEGPDGALYGTVKHWSSRGSDYDSLFKINKDGTGYTIVHQFPANGSDPAGDDPRSDLIRASDGNIYGTCFGGGQYGNGTVYKLDTTSGNVTPLCSFVGTRGIYPVSSFSQYRLLQGSDGSLYGVTRQGGLYGYGTAFKLSLSGAFSVLADFDYWNVGEFKGMATEGTANPLIQYGANFYGTSYYGGIFSEADGSSQGYGAAVSISSAGAIKVLNSFYQCDGVYPSGPPAQQVNSITRKAIYYGECSGGGEYGQGLLYVIDSKGNYRILHHFHDDQTNYLDGSGPSGGLLLARDGKLYGMTSAGGYYGYGTLFQITTRGAFKVLHHFYHFNTSEGHYPICALVQGVSPDDNLYGTLMAGGINDNGCLFKTNTTGANFQVLHYFTGSDGSQLECTPLPDGNGDLFGTCAAGGSHSSGTVWVCKTDGSEFGDYCSFDGSFGAIPYYAGQLVYLQFSLPPSHLLEGTTAAGGTYNQGTIYAVNILLSGQSVVHSFNDSIGEGNTPSGGMLYDGASGNYYGCCLAGGAYGKGTLYALHRSTGVLTVLHAFTGGKDGGTPNYCPVLGPDGLLYGVTDWGGLYGYGVLYKQTTTP